MKLRAFLLSLAAAATLGRVSAGELVGGSPPTPRMPRDLPMQSILYDAEEASKGAAAAGRSRLQLKQDLASRKIQMADDGRVLVEIAGPMGASAVPEEVVGPFGAEITNTWRHMVEALVPVDNLSALARALPKGYFMQRADVPGYDAVGGEGATATNSDSYRDAGRNGAGLTIAVIDGGYLGLTASQAAGDAPAAYTAVNYTASGFEAGTNRHGTGCVESAFDHCPGATWRIYKIDSITDYGTAVDNCQANGVDIISHSISRYNRGWGDDTGEACAAANDAASTGILFFTSAGNRAESHWQGDYNPGLGQASWHDWVNGDERLSITLAANAENDFYLSWDTTGGTYNYDLYLYDSNLNVLASSTNGGNSYESFTYTNGAAAKVVWLAVWRDSGGVTEMEIFMHGDSDFDEYAIAAGSTASPSNSMSTNVISNGAVAFGLWPSANGTVGIIKDYSSQGPSNGGMTLPDIVGPTDTTTTAYGGGFGGTSGATPNNAGAACAFWSADTQLGASAIRWLMYEQADLWKDWGVAGNDNVYGRGGTLLTDFANNTLWVARSYGNMTDMRSAPFYTTQAAYDAAVSGGRLLVFPGGNYPEALSAIGTKSLTIQTIENPANLGF